MFKILKTLGFPVSTRPFAQLFLALVALDTAFIVTHLGLRLGEGLGIFAALPERWNIISDYGWPEMFNHVKWAGVVLCLAALYLRTRLPVFAAMAVGYVIVLADDRLGLHEAGGEALALRLPILHRLGMAPHEAGELVMWAMFGSVIVFVAVLGFLATPRAERGVAKPFLLAFLGVLFFGVGMDVVQEPFRMIPGEALQYWTIYALRLIEDGGEMYMTSLNLAVAVTTLVAYRAATALAVRPVAGADDMGDARALH